MYYNMQSDQQFSRDTFYMYLSVRAMTVQEREVYVLKRSRNDCTGA